MVPDDIEVVVNGNAQPVPAGTTITQLLAQVAPTGKRVAVERNGAIVPRSAHSETVLAPGDALEVVIAVGGG